MIHDFQLKMEEKYMESLYFLMNINTERKWVKSKTSLLPQVPKVVYDMSPPPEIQDPICCVNFFYEYKIMLIGNNCIYRGTMILKTFPFFIRYNIKTYDFL